MKMMRWAALLVMVACCGVVARAQVPDGGVGTKHSLNSTPIYTLGGPLAFTSCATATDPEIVADCTAFGGAQAVFAGLNDSPNPWNKLTFDLSGYNETADPTLGCFGNDVFSSCTITPNSDCTTTPTNCSITATFLQGSGTGIECNVLSSPNGSACVENSAAAIINNATPGNPILPYDWPNCSGFFGIPGAVCGSPHFAVGIGGKDPEGHPIDFNVPLSLDASFAANTPEPQSLLLVGAAMLGLVFLASKKRLLV